MHIISVIGSFSFDCNWPFGIKFPFLVLVWIFDWATEKKTSSMFYGYIIWYLWQVTCVTTLYQSSCLWRFPISNFEKMFPIPFSIFDLQIKWFCLWCACKKKMPHSINWILNANSHIVQNINKRITIIWNIWFDSLQTTQLLKIQWVRND